MRLSDGAQIEDTGLQRDEKDICSVLFDRGAISTVLVYCHEQFISLTNNIFYNHPVFCKEFSLCV